MRMLMSTVGRACLAAWLCLSLATWIQPAWADDSAVVIYPEVSGAYRGVFDSIIQGIEDQRIRVRRVAISEGASREEIASRVASAGSRAIVALGRQGVSAALELNSDYAVFIGGIAMQPGGGKPFGGISLAPDPALVFARLRNFVPSVKRIHVVYNSRNNDWLIRNAREDAAAAGFELLTRDVQDLREAARAFQDIASNADTRRDAIWLINDETIFSEDYVLPFILKEAWNRSIPLFSNSVAHVKRGALFALYPDNYAMGRSLGQIVLAHSAGSPRAMVPLRDVRIAVNLQTASHLALNISYAQQRSFDLTFPTP